MNLAGKSLPLARRRPYLARNDHKPVLSGLAQVAIESRFSDDIHSCVVPRGLGRLHRFAGHIDFVSDLTDDGPHAGTMSGHREFGDEV